MEGERLRKDWSCVGLEGWFVGGEEADEEDADDEASVDGRGAGGWTALDTPATATPSTTAATSRASSPAILPRYTPLAGPSLDYFARPSPRLSSTSATSTPAWPSPQSPFLATPLFSPAAHGARTPSTAPSSPMTAKAHSRHKSLTFSAPPAPADEGGVGGNLLGLDLFGTGRGATVLAAGREAQDADATLHAVVHGLDRSCLGAVFTSILAWTLSPSARASLELAPHDDRATESDSASSLDSNDFHATASAPPTTPPWIDATAYSSWSPLAGLSSHAQDRHLSAACPAARSYAEATAAAAAATLPVGRHSSVLVSGARFELGELEDYELTWQTDANEVEAGIEAVLGVLLGMGSFI